MFIFLPQITIDTSSLPIESIKETISNSGILESPYFILFLDLLGAFVGLFVILKIIKKILKKYMHFNPAFQQKILLITVPKDLPQKEQQEKKMEDLLSVLENFYANLGGLAPEKGIKSSWTGRKDHFSFEIVKEINGLISFYVAAPERFLEFLKQQILSVYAQAQIEEVSDYNIFTPQGKVAGVYLTLSRSFIFPINTYKKINADPLIALTNSLSKLEKGEGALIQIVARSSHESWHSRGARLASEIQQGKTVEKALREVDKGALTKFFSWFGKNVWTKTPSKDEPIKEKETHHLSPMEEEVVKGLEAKTSKAGFDVNVRMIVSGANEEQARYNLDNILNSFSQFMGYKYGNGFKAHVLSGKYLDQLVKNSIYRDFDETKSFILNTEEMVSLYHLPLPQTETPGIRWLLFKKLPSPNNLPTEGLLLGENIFRGTVNNVYLKTNDRRRHTYIIGMTGTGKSYLIANAAIQDIKNGQGVCVIDPHGDLVGNILPYIPKERIDDVIYFDPAFIERPMGLNLLEYDPKYPEQKTFVINEMINILDKLYDLRTTGGPMFEQYMRNAMLLIMDHPESGSTLMEVPKVLADPDFRHYKLEQSKNPVVRDFWTKEAEKAGGEAALSNMTPYITSKLNQFVANDIMRPIIGQQNSAFNFREVMDQRKILLINLAKGKIGDMNAYLLGLVLVGKILMSALSRTDIPEEQRNDFYLYIDEFQNFITESINTILAEARKYRLNLIIAHQYLGQLVNGQDTKVRDAVFGNVGTIVSFRIGVDDAETMAKQFAPVVSEFDVMNIEKYNAYVRLLIDNAPSRAFNMHCFPLPKDGNEQIAKTCISLSQLKYGKDKKVVESEILLRTKVLSKEVKDEEEEEEL